MGNLKPRFRSFTWAIVLSIAIVSGCNPSSQKETAKIDDAPSTRLPDVFLISVDTLRADHLGCYGNKQSTTPTIDSLAKRGAQFESAITTIPVTLPAHSSMLSGQIPPVHGVRDNGGDQLSPTVETLTETLKSHGYQTGAFIGAQPLKADRGLSQGFDKYDDNISGGNPSNDRFAGRSDRPAEVVAASACGWISQCNKSKPLFAFVHLFDPHWPYVKKMEGAEQPSYLGEIAYVDRVLTRFLKTVDSDRDPKNRIIVFTSDHGEGLGEHDEKTHCIFVYDSTIRIPLLINAPNLDPVKVQQPVSVIDVAPTILELIGLEGLQAADGISLVPAMESGTAEIRDLYFESRYGEFRFGWAPLKGIRRGNLKYISAPRPEIYDLESDPGELTNLYNQKKPLAAELNDVLVTIGDGIRTKTELSDEAIRKLANLGYVSAKVSDHDPNIKRPDPKDRIEFYQQFQNAYNWFTSGAKEEALKTMLGLESSMSDSPQFYSEWAYFQTGAEKWQEAERSYLRCLELDPDYPEAALNLSAVSIKLEKFQQGMDRLKILLAKEPENGLAHLYAGFCAKELDQPKVAIEHWSQFVDLLPGHPDAPKIRAAIGR